MHEMTEQKLNGKQGRLVPVEEAVGTVLAHDITEIRPGQFKGVAFKKGHTVRPEDVDHLRRLGKMHLFVLEIPEGMMHEDEAAGLMAKALTGPGVEYDPRPKEGKINLQAARDGLLKVDVEALTAFNMVDGIMCAARHTNTVVKKGDVIAGTRAIPLVIDRQAVEKAVAAAGNGVFAVKEMSRLDVGLVVTGNEVFQGLIEDKSVPVVMPKLKAVGCRVLRTEYAPDDPDVIAGHITSLIDEGARLVVATGGMSVDRGRCYRPGRGSGRSQEHGLWIVGPAGRHADVRRSRPGRCSGCAGLCHFP